MNDLLAGRERALRALELSVKRKLEGFLHGEITGLRSGPGTEPNVARRFVHDHDAPGFLGTSTQEVVVERRQRAEVDHAGLDPGVG